jgi:hypothetical protein
MRAQEAFARSLIQWQRVGTREGMIDWLTRIATLAANQDRSSDANDRCVHALSFRISGCRSHDRAYP